MPIYEYKCKHCNELFSRDMSVRDRDRIEMIRTQPPAIVMAEDDSDVLRCPKCHDVDVEQQLGVFFAKTSRKS